MHDIASQFSIYFLYLIFSTKKNPCEMVNLIKFYKEANILSNKLSKN